MEAAPCTDEAACEDEDKDKEEVVVEEEEEEAMEVVAVCGLVLLGVEAWSSCCC